MTNPMHMEEGIKEFYPSERNAVLSIKHQLMSELAYRRPTIAFTEDQMRRQFDERAKERCAEIGLVVSVVWTWDDPLTGEFSPTVSDNPDDFNVYYLPKLVFERRIDRNHEVDHDKMKFEIRSGEADGQPGVIRADGSKHEDPTKKNIY